MSIQMVGIDHTRASVEVREVFSFTKKNIAEAMETWKKLPCLHGVVMISTCNRTELWASVEAQEAPDLFALLCAEKGLDASDYRTFAVHREERAAAEHLFALASGLESRILGEDQIITQVKDALALARENYSTDHVLEVLFRMAVTAAKKVKTDVALSAANASAIHQAMAALGAEGYSFAGKKCLVIGNGEMGKLSAMVLADAGADVTVTVRQYRSGHVEIPAGCRRINYGERHSLLGDCDLVVSATASPNLTLMAADVRDLVKERSLVMIDLAVPRDLDPAIGKLPGIRLYDIDDFGVERENGEMRESIRRARDILDTYLGEFFDWYEGRAAVAQIQGIKAAAAENFRLRMQKQVRAAKRQAEGQEAAVDALAKASETALEKVVNRMIFGMKEQLGDGAFLECLEALEKVFDVK